MEAILSDASVSITELKRNPSAVIDAADDAPVAVLVHNKPSAYLVPAATYQRLMERLEDLELAALVRSRAKERRAKDPRRRAGVWAARHRLVDTRSGRKGELP